MSKVLNVFYGVDRLPYKDQERQVHYPIVGNSFAGASLVDEIRFYAKDLGTENNVFVGIAKRPDGQRGYQVLTYGYDAEINEPYWTFNVAGWFTEKVGNVFVSLNVYEGGVDIKVNQENGLSIVSGTPIIQATGSVVLSINYAPIMDNGYGAVPTIDVQEALSLVGSKVNTDYLTTNYYNKTDVDNKLLLKADVDYVNHFIKTLEVSMDSSTYVLTFTCKDGTGTTIYNQSIDLPLESVVVSGEYDNNTKSIILTLQNGNTITIPVSDLVDGLVDTTTFETAIQGIQNELDTKANANEVYTKVEVDNKLDLKADKTTTASLQNQINDLNSRLVVVEEAIIGVDTLTFTALSYNAIPNVSDNLYPIIYSGGLDTKEIKGNSFVHTQLVQNGNFVNASGWDYSAGTIEVSQNIFKATLVNATNSQSLYRTCNITPNHKYLAVCDFRCSRENGLVRIAVGAGNYIATSVSANTWTKINGIITPTTSNNYIYFYTTPASTLQVGDTVEFSNFQLFDLTKDFGAGNEPTTYDQAVSMYASKGIDITNYVEYTQGTLIDSKPIKIISRGYNLFDGNLTGTQYKISDYIEVVGGKSYTLEQTEVGYNSKVIYQYDENKVQIKTNYLNASQTLSSATMEQQTKFVRFQYDFTGQTQFTPTNICFHLTGSRTAYAPYKAPTEYPITTEILRSAGSVQDSAVSKKVGSSKLTDLTWNARGEIVSGLYTFSAVLSDAKVYPINTSVSNINIISDFGTIEPVNDVNNANATNKVFVLCTGTTTIIYVCNTTNINPVSQSNLINYELATPTEQTATLPTDIEIEKGGSIEVVYDNGNTTPADFVFECAVYKPLE